MRIPRVVKWAAIVVIVITVALAAVVASALLGRQSITDGAEVNGVRIIQDGIVSVAMFPAGQGKVGLVDGGNDSEAKAILAELSRRGLGPDAVTAIFITHGHGDHIGGVKKFPRAQAYALDREVALVEGHERAHGPATRLMPARPTGIAVRGVKDGETVTAGTTPVRVFAVPGHTAGSAAYLVDGVLVMGDAADIGGDGKLFGSPWLFSDNQAEDREALAQLARRLEQEHVQVKAIACAHSGLGAGGLAPLVAYVQANR